MSNEQRAKSNEQRPKSNKQRAKSFTSLACEPVEKYVHRNLPCLTVGGGGIIWQFSRFFHSNIT